MARGLRGVRDDLSELGRHLLDIACFLHPLLNPAHTDSPPPTPTGSRRRRAARRSPSPHPAAPPAPSLLAGILSDLAEIGGSLRGGFSRAAAPPAPAAPDPAAPEALLAAAASPPASPHTPAAAAAAAAAAHVAEDVVGAARALAARPEAWIDFPVLALDQSNYLFPVPFGTDTTVADIVARYFPALLRCGVVSRDSVISDIQRDHMESIDKLVPDLASLRTRLCPSYMDEDIFWKIYFRLLDSNINDHSSEDDIRSVPTSVHHINEIESDSPPHICEIESVKSNQEGYQPSDGRALPKTRSERSIDQWVFAKSKSEESMDQWSEIPSDVESFREGKRYLSSEELSDVDSANVVVMDKYMDSLLSDRRNLPYASSSVRRDSVRRKPALSTDYSHRPPQPTPPASLSKKESWDVIEDSEFDILDRGTNSCAGSMSWRSRSATRFMSSRPRSYALSTSSASRSSCSFAAAALALSTSAAAFAFASASSALAFSSSSMTFSACPSENAA
ncbi:hypothetical protein U9M48_029581 [Paspalum notatum var. saurae]|uniref:BSD domain-containing protein n=1 Tax=Paspalum notatum var. saurae TaxID=547442 RepID=A0AAQ3TYU6_PASNO